MFKIQLITLISLITIFVSVVLFLKFKKKNISTKSLKIVSLVLALIFSVWYIGGHESIPDAFGLVGGPLASKTETAFAMINIWLSFINVLLIILYPFFRNVRTVNNLVKYVSIPVGIFNIACIRITTIGLFGNVFDTEFSFEHIRLILFTIQLAICLVYPLVILLEGNYKLSVKDALFMITGFLGLAFCIMPAYTLEVLIGKLPIYMKTSDFTLFHRILIYLGIVVPFAIYFVFRNKSKETIKFALTYLILGTLIVFSLHHKYDSFINVTSWPLHLCNTAMYILALCIIFKWDKLFYFTYFINVLGAFLAMTMPNYGASLELIDTSLLVFWYNHWIAFFVPIIMVALGVYERPKFKQFMYASIAFTIYFVLILIVNAWFSNYASVDYFFVNSGYVADKLGTWAKDLRNVTAIFYIGDLKFVLYPLYQFLFWLVYMLISLGMWFLYENGFAIADQFADIRLKLKLEKQKKLELISILDGRSEDLPMDEKNSDKLILKKFSKKYSGSRVYAVKDADLEVCAGEIFGFLGPNGAGKSTIIKSIVGIQPLTSGSIEVCGYDIERQPVACKQNIGFVPDHYALYEKLTGREYVNYIADLYGVSKEERDVRIKKYVKLFELEHSFDNQIKTYSHGMKQKITIMSALVHNPKVWILDEPLTGLDPQSIFQVKECMKQHAKEGNIVFFSSHIIDVVEKICDKIAIIKKGEILCTRTLKDIDKNEGGLEKFYLKNIGQSYDEEK